MRLGGPIFDPYDEPTTWVKAVQALGYRAAYCPVKLDADDAIVRAYEVAAREADIVIAEVGAWSNPLAPDMKERAVSLDKCKRSLDLADRIGERCCVNITGSRGNKWDGPHGMDLTDETFDMIVATTREIIDAIKPKRTPYTLEMMQWAYPDSPECYLRLLNAIDRDACAVHLDPVNMINSPQRYFNNGDLIRECFAKLGPRIRSCHAKDVILHNKALVHLDEVRPGLGKLDYGAYLDDLSRLDPNTPLMLEHLPNAEEYALAAEHVRTLAAQHGYTV